MVPNVATMASCSISGTSCQLTATRSMSALSCSSVMMYRHDSSGYEHSSGCGLEAAVGDPHIPFSLLAWVSSEVGDREVAVDDVAGDPVHGAVRGVGVSAEGGEGV